MSGPVGELFGGRNWPGASGYRASKKIEHVTAYSFCEMSRCTREAAWKIGNEGHAVAFCSKHTLSTMRNARLWHG